MRASQRLDILDSIGAELQSRYTYTEIDDYLAAYGVKPPTDVSVNSKRVYAKAALRETNEKTLGEILTDLELGNFSSVAAASQPPKLWRDPGFRLFISHTSSERDKAKRLRDSLTPYGILSFVAHEDIEPTLEWQVEIERALHCMNAFLSVHTVGFSKSYWTQQEIGFAVAKGVKIVALGMGEDPTGFLANKQALPRRNETAEQVAKRIYDLFVEDPLTSASFASLDLLDDVPF